MEKEMERITSIQEEKIKVLTQSTYPKSLVHCQQSFCLFNLQAEPFSFLYGVQLAGTKRASKGRSFPPLIMQCNAYCVVTVCTIWTVQPQHRNNRTSNSIIQCCSYPTTGLGWTWIGLDLIGRSE